MKEKIKNIIIVLLIIIVAILSVFTVNYFKQKQSGGEINNTGEPPERPDGNNGNMQEPPEKPGECGMNQEKMLQKLEKLQ